MLRLLLLLFVASAHGKTSLPAGLDVTALNSPGGDMSFREGGNEKMRVTSGGIYVLGSADITTALLVSKCTVMSGRTIECSKPGAENPLQIVFAAGVPSSGSMPGDYVVSCSIVDSGGTNGGLIVRTNRYSLTPGGALTHGNAHDITDGTVPTLSVTYSGGSFTVGCSGGAWRKMLSIRFNHYPGGLVTAP